MIALDIYPSHVVGGYLAYTYVELPSVLFVNIYSAYYRASVDSRAVTHRDVDHIVP